MDEPTGIVPLDLSKELGIKTGGATSPGLLANFVRIHAGEQIDTAVAVAKLEEIAARPGANDKSRVSVLLANAEEEQTLTITHVLWAMFGLLPLEDLAEKVVQLLADQIRAKVGQPICGTVGQAAAREQIDRPGTPAPLGSRHTRQGAHHSFEVKCLL